MQNEIYSSFLILGVTNFNAIHGCLKCVGEGKYSHIGRCVVNTSLNKAPRTDGEFRKSFYGFHHKSITPLIQIPNLDISQGIVIADRLHLIDGALGFQTKFSNITDISEMLTSMHCLQKFTGNCV